VDDGGKLHPAHQRYDPMPTYRMVHGNDAQVTRETFTEIEVERENAWMVVLRGKEAILRAPEEHVHSLEELTGEEG